MFPAELPGRCELVSISEHPLREIFCQQLKHIKCDT